MLPLILICLLIGHSVTEEIPDILSVNVDGLLMAEASITASATCGMSGPEKFCRLVTEEDQNILSNIENSVHCDICDDKNQTKRHPIEYAKSDDDNLWWQSPSMAQGLEYQRVNVTIDLLQVYQIVYILLKMGESPRPGNWILERSLDGITYFPWIYFAETPYTCYKLFRSSYPNMQITTSSRPLTVEDDEVFCTTYYSQHRSLQSGEIIISLINGRKSLISENDFTQKPLPRKLIDFLSARFIRFRFLKHVTMAADLMSHRELLEKSVYNRYYYSLRNVEIGGKCICNNHADKCNKVIENGITVAKCQCEHKTCGNNCEYCCPFFNQQRWRPGVSCEECNCNRKADVCVYNHTVSTLQMSMNKYGKMDGGGVCVGCRENTDGINCEKCKKGYFRPWNVLATTNHPCKPCQCYGDGTIGDCISNGEETEYQKPGDCICKRGYTGPLCNQCDVGYERFSNGKCRPCACSVEGSVTSSLYQCKPPCNCKINVDPRSNCTKCKSGYFNLDPKNPDGCQPCFCFGITNQCSNLNVENIKTQQLTEWKISSLHLRKFVDPWISSLQYPYIDNSLVDKVLQNPSVYYWIAPKAYLGNWLTSYMSVILYVVKINIGPQNGGSQIDSPDLIIKCGNKTLQHSISTEDHRLQRKVLVPVKKSYWRISSPTGQETYPTDADFMSCLVTVESFMIKAKYYSSQKSVELLNVTLNRGELSEVFNEMPFIEKCECPTGFTGLSCEACELGYRRPFNILVKGSCERCHCYNHSNVCDANSGECQNCIHNTIGPHCDQCKSGFYGDPKSGKADACKKCSCPLIDYQMTSKCSNANSEKYICSECSKNTGGPHCDTCIDGYFGNPMKKIECQKCKCNNNEESCDSITGDCKCSYSTMGIQCEICKHGFYGAALKKNCTNCYCDKIGSMNQFCDKKSGQCPCKNNFIGRKCDRCKPGMFLKDEKCVPCRCNKQGRKQSKNFCSSTTGECFCRDNVSGISCEKCFPQHYAFPSCLKCACSAHSISEICNVNNGSCVCGENVVGSNCDKCKEAHFWVNRTHCESCKCDKGSVSDKCNMDTGRCLCATNVVGRSCDKCAIGYFGLSSAGCKECPKCSIGKVCDNDGKCICPVNTIGNSCENCASYTWGYNNMTGCKKCDCSNIGSNSQNCDLNSGQCDCKSSYQGRYCNKCQAGHFGFPNCHPCECNANGTITGALNQCDPVTGQCSCKENVEDRKCDRCKKGAFGLNNNYEGGCFSCYCSGHSQICEPRKNLKHMKHAEYNITFLDDIKSYVVEKDHNVIELEQNAPKIFGWPLSLFRPVFVELMKLLPSRDLTAFYRLKLLEATIDCSEGQCGREGSIQTEAILHSYGGQMELRYMINKTGVKANHIVVELTESSKNGDWFLIKYGNKKLEQPTIINNKSYIGTNLGRDLLILALLNVSSFQLQLYNDKVNPIFVKLQLTIYNVEKDPQGSIATIEKCQCDKITTGNHCQEPIKGFYRTSNQLPKVDVKKGVLNTDTRITVDVNICQCNGHSDICNTLTGVCYNCTDFTAGDQCHYCANGYYGNPKNHGTCSPCECPNSKFNYAITCGKATNSNEFFCSCNDGYTGQKCEKCYSGFFGDPTRGIKCKPCSCNVEGSISERCDENGKCDCVAGVKGIKCDQCQNNYVVENKTCRSCLTGCTKDLFSRLDDLHGSTMNIKWKSISSIENTWIRQTNSSILNLKEKLKLIKRFYLAKTTLDYVANIFQKLKTDSDAKLKNAENMKNKLSEELQKLLNLFKDIDKTISGEKLTVEIETLKTNATIMLNEIKKLVLKTTLPKDMNDVVRSAEMHVDKLNKYIKDLQSLIQPEQTEIIRKLIDQTKLATIMNKDNENYLKQLNEKNSEYEIRKSSLERRLNEIRIVIEELSIGRRVLQMKSIDLDNLIVDLTKKLNKLEKVDNSLTNYSQTRHLTINDQVREVVQEKISKAKDLIRNFTGEQSFLENAEKARNAYANISRDIMTVEKTIDETKSELNEVKNKQNIEHFKTKLTEFTDSDKVITTKQQKLNRTVEKFVEIYETEMKRALTLKQELDSKDLYISKMESNDAEVFKKKLNSTRAFQRRIQSDLIDKLNEPLLNFTIPTVNKLTTEDIKQTISNMAVQYGEIAKNINSSKEIINDLRKSLQQLKEQIRQTKLHLELAHGAAARSPEPIRLDESCVRHYRTYYLPKSYDLSLKFYIKPEYRNAKNLVLIGYDVSGGSINSFAFTIEENELVFWYDYGSTKNELRVKADFVNSTYFTGVFISWNQNQWSMNVISHDKSISKSATASSKITDINNKIHIGSETHLFIGGFPPDELLGNLKLEGKLIEFLRSNYREKFYKGCLYGVQIMNADLGLTDFNAVSSRCNSSKKLENICKVNTNDINKIEILQSRLKRVKREMLEFDIHFQGQGYVWTNTSVDGCMEKLNKAFEAYTWQPTPQTDSNNQIISVLGNDVKNFGLVFGQSNEKKWFTYWHGGTQSTIQEVKFSYIRWKIFDKKIEGFDIPFGIEEICDPYTYMYIGNIPDHAVDLRQKLKQFNIQYYEFVGSVGIKVGNDDVFKFHNTRYVLRKQKHLTDLRHSPFNSIFVSKGSGSPIIIEPKNYSDIFEKGLSLNVHFLNIPLKKTLTLVHIETSDATVTLTVTPKLNFILSMNNVKREVLATQKNETADWGSHNVMMFFKSDALTLAVDNIYPNSEQFIPSTMRTISKIQFGSTDSPNQPYFLYNVYLGDKLLNFNTLPERSLPAGVYLKQPPVSLQPKSQLESESAMFDRKTSERVSTKNPQLLQSDAAAPPFIGSDHLYSSSKSSAFKYMLKSPQSSDYPLFSTWFDGNVGSYGHIPSPIVEKHILDRKNTISLLAKSQSQRNETLMIIRFEDSKSLTLFTTDGHLAVYNDWTQSCVVFPVGLVNGEWHSIEVEAKDDSKKSLRIFQDGYYFDLLSEPLSSLKPVTVDIGDNSKSSRNFLKCDKKNVKIEPFTGCIDLFQINKRTVFIDKDIVSAHLTKCPKLLEFINEGGQVDQQYAPVFSPGKLIKFKMEQTPQEEATDYTYIFQMKVKYTGYEEGSLLIAGEGKRFCAVVLSNNKLHLNYANLNTNKRESESMSLAQPMWYDIQFIVYYMKNMLSICILKHKTNRVEIMMSSQDMFSSSACPSIFLGGHPDLSESEKFFVTKTRNNFVGCLSDVEYFFNAKKYKIEFEKSEHFISGRCSVDRDFYLNRMKI